MPDDAVTVDSMLEPYWIVGDTRECAHRFYQLYDEVGGFGYVLTTTHDPDDPGLEQTSLRLLMEEVAPRLKRLGSSRGDGGTRRSVVRSSKPASRSNRLAQSRSERRWERPLVC